MFWSVGCKHHFQKTDAELAEYYSKTLLVNERNSPATSNEDESISNIPKRRRLPSSI